MSTHLSSPALQEIVDAGAKAPSGDNLQPWQLQWQGDTLRLSVNRQIDQSLYNVSYRASVIALGAMAENMAIAAGALGLSCDIVLQEHGSGLPEAHLTFQPAIATSYPLVSAIDQRCTNRRAFERRAVPQATIEQMRSALPADDQSTLVFIERKDDRRTIARAASLNDRVLFEVKQLHDPLYESIRWSGADAERTRDGLFVKTLELGPMGPGFKAMKSWPLVRGLNVLGSSRMAPQHSFRTFMTAPLFAFLQMHGDAYRHFFEGGRRMERLWLAATAAGLSVQPMAGMLYLLQHLRPGGSPSPLDTVRPLLVRAQRLFASVLPLADGHAPIMIFRLGYAGAPSARALRRHVSVRSGADGRHPFDRQPTTSVA